MRILVVSQYFWPEDFRVNDLVAGLRDRDHEVTVLTGAPNYPDGEIYEEFRKSPDEFCLFGDVKIVRVPILGRGSLAITLVLNYLTFAISASIVGSWKLRGRPFDAIFVFQTSPITAALPALLLRRLKGAPVLMWVLDLWPDTLSALGVVRSKFVLGPVGRLVQFIYKRCDRILIQSEAFRANVASFGGTDSKIRYFPNWIEPTFEGGLADIVPAPEVRQFAETFNIMFAGNIGESQDMPALLEAACLTRDLDDVRWLIVGEGRASGRLRSDIVKLGLEGRVILLGRHGVDRMPAFMAGADALIVSLRPEPVFRLTVPGKVQTYLAAGKPVLGMIDGEAARIIEASGGGITCAASDGRALAANVRKLRSLDSETRRAMGRNGRSYARREFGRDTLFSRLVEWLDEARLEFRQPN
jgi:colanic acid biosynthesis glycosyl transferase WcaI